MADTREIWVDIKNYEGKYKISNLGRVKSLERQVSHDGITWTQPERIMCHWCGTTSLYDCVRLYKGGVGKKFSVHRLVAQHFLPDWNPGLEVNHIDGNRDNNRADNLEMCTHQRNMEHAIAGGLKRDYGEKSVNAKLTNADFRNDGLVLGLVVLQVLYDGRLPVYLVVTGIAPSRRTVQSTGDGLLGRGRELPQQVIHDLAYNLTGHVLVLFGNGPAE